LIKSNGFLVKKFHFLNEIFSVQTLFFQNKKTIELVISKKPFSIQGEETLVFLKQETLRTGDFEETLLHPK